jgi:hypothetical protein
MSVTVRPQPGGGTRKSIRDMWWHWEGERERKEKAVVKMKTVIFNLLEGLLIAKA